MDLGISAVGTSSKCGGFENFFWSEDLANRKITSKVTKIKKDMKTLGIYKPEFDTIIKAYADILYQYEMVWNEYESLGCPAFAEHPGGIKKHPSAIQLEDLRKQMTIYSDRLGLNPKALDSIKNAQTIEVKSKLDSALDNIADVLKGNSN